MPGQSSGKATNKREPIAGWQKDKWQSTKERRLQGRNQNFEQTHEKQKKPKAGIHKSAWFLINTEIRFSY